MIKEKYISLELAKQIAEAAKEKGIELPESEYVWCYGENYNHNTKKTNFNYGIVPKYLSNEDHRTKIWNKEKFPAFCCYELGEILPRYLKIEVRKHLEPQKHLLRIYKSNSGGYGCKYKTWSECDTNNEKRFRDDSFPECLGKMLKYLITNGLLK